jgi:mono/diheme cytochrome c family protein
MQLLKCLLGLSIVALVLPVSNYAQEAKPQMKNIAMQTSMDKVQRGRYLVTITGCNDCHTPGYAETNGKVAEKQWLTGDRLGWRGPWGTTYPANLRLYFSGLSENEWVKIARTFEPRPPMPWYGVREMQEQDLRAMYQFIKSLGPAGEAVPVYVPPDKEPQQPFVMFPAPPK